MRGNGVGIEMKTRITILLILIAGATLTYVMFWNMFEIYLFGGFWGQGTSSHVCANSNDVFIVQAEVTSPDFRSMVFSAAGVGAFGAWRLRNLQIQFDGENISSWHFSKTVNSNIADVVSAYLLCRAEGHSAAYCHDVLQLLADHSSRTNRHLVTIYKKEMIIPDKWIQDVSTSTNKDGSTLKRIVVIDGNIAWSYKALYRSDGKFQSCFPEKRDAIEFNPAYTNIIKEVENQVEEKMKKEGSYGLFGSCHEFWRTKKEILNKKGIDWRSPPELNPDAGYD